MDLNQIPNEQNMFEQLLLQDLHMETQLLKTYGLNCISILFSIMNPLDPKLVMAFHFKLQD